MKIAFTGHSRGIGKALADTLATEHTIEGFSRSNGYDINEKQSIIIRAVKDCDVFVNNAYSGLSQVELLKGVWGLWKDNPNKTIVNIVSRTKYYKVGQTRSEEYCMYKRALDDFAKTLTFTRKKCRIININPGYVRTDMVADVSQDVEMLTAQEVADCIVWTINQPHHIEIGELSIWRP